MIATRSEEPGANSASREIPAAKHGKSEDSSVVAADDAEHGADRLRIAHRQPPAGATLRLSPNDVNGKLDPIVTASTPGTVRSRSTSARCDCSPSRFVVPGQTRIDLHEQSAVETKPGIGRRRRDRAHQEQSTGREQEQRERDLADHQGIADPDASRPAPFVAGLALEIGRRPRDRSMSRPARHRRPAWRPD